MENNLILGDCIEEMKTMSSMFDMVITSPPYNVGVDYGDGKEGDSLPQDRYREFAVCVMRGIYDVLKEGGRACIEIGSSGRNFPLSYIWQHAAYKCGLNLYSEIVLQHRKSNPCAWGSYLKSDNVYTIPNFHMLYVFYKDTPTKRGGETTITKGEWLEWTRGLWKINWALGAIKSHPAQFPVELPMRCLKLFGHKDDLVLDPMMGTGTTGVACAIAKRKFIGIELREHHYKVAERRIRDEVSVQRKVYKTIKDNNDYGEEVDLPLFLALERK